MLSALVNAEILSTNVETFSKSHAVYFSYISPGRNRIPLSFYQENDILLRLVPHYGCPASEHRLAINTRIN